MPGSDEVDLEFIAAFIDGRLSSAERQRALRMLGQSEAAFDVYADALRARGDIVDGGVVPLTVVREQRTRLPWRIIGSAAAAAVVLIAVVPMMQARREGAVLGATSSELVRTWISSPSAAAALVALDERGWSLTRGSNERVVDSTLAFRLGARAVDLQVALGQRDTARADRIVRETLETLDGVELADAVKADYRTLREGLRRGDPVDQLATSASRGEAVLRDVLQSFWFDFGRWVAAGEIAAKVRSEAFFSMASTERFLELAASRNGVSSDDVAVLRDIRGLVENGVADSEFDTIQRNFTALIERHGR